MENAKKISSLELAKFLGMEDEYVKLITESTINEIIKNTEEEEAILIEKPLEDEGFFLD